MNRLYVVVSCLISVQISLCGYFYSNNKRLTWAEARDECFSKDMELTKVNSYSEWMAIKNYIKDILGDNNMPISVWIGLKYDMTSSPPVYRGINCEEPTFYNWAPGEPDKQATALCIRMSRDQLLYKTTHCSLKKAYVCSDRSVHYVHRNLSRVTSRYHDDVTLECPYCSTVPILTVEWQFSSAGLFNTIDVTRDPNKYSGLNLTSTSLTIMNVSDNDIGSYRCQVSNRVGIAEGLPIEFDIEDFPVIFAPRLAYKASQGEQLYIKCDVSGRPVVTEVSWIFQNATDTIPFKNLYSSFGSVTTNVSYEFRIDSVIFQDGGSYTCSATNSVGTSMSQLITIEVFGIEVNIPSSQYSVKYGDSITLKCDITSKPALQGVTWTRHINGEYIDINIEQTAKYNGSTILQPSLTIVDTNLTDQGTYYCHGNNSIYYANSSTLLTIIGGVPNITVNQSVLTVNESDTVTLFCTINSIPETTSVFWTKDRDGATVPIYNSTHTALFWPCLKFPSVVMADAAIYTCHAVNAEGVSSSSKIRLEVNTADELCPCRCEYKTKMEYWALHTNNYTMDELQTILAPVVKEIRKNLSVNVDSLTMTKQKHISATDKRTSSASIGIVGVLFLACIVFFIILSDGSSVVFYFKTRSKKRK